jgi:hypothetical protein
MYLFKAKQAAQAELERALEETGLTLERVREFLKNEPRYASPLHRSPHSGATTTADLVYEIAGVIDKSRFERARATLKSSLPAVGRALKSALLETPAQSRAAAGFARRAAEELAAIAREKAPKLADDALGAARTKLASVLPFVRAAKSAGADGASDSRESGVASAAE